jgi:hypothetical protein
VPCCARDAALSIARYALCQTHLLPGRAQPRSLGLRSVSGNHLMKSSYQRAFPNISWPK